MISYKDPNPQGMPTVVLLHGLGVNKQSWGYQMDALINNNCRPIAIDIPGYGESPKPKGVWKIGKVANSIMDLISRITQEPVFLIGLSLGGCICLKIIIDKPQMIRGAILVNTFARLTNGGLIEYRYYLQRGLSLLIFGVENQARIVAERVFPLPEQYFLRQATIETILQSDPGVYRQTMLELVLMNFSPYLDRVTCPSLVVTGDQDTTLSRASQYELVERIKKCRHVIIKDSGHATPIDQPDEFNRIMLDFMSGVVKQDRNSNHQA